MRVITIPVENKIDNSSPHRLSKQNMHDFNSLFSSSWRLISVWTFLNWAFVFPSFYFKIDTSSSNHAVSSCACNNWNRNDSHESCDSVFTISAVSRETVSSASDVMSLLTVNDSSVNDSSSRRLLFFGENLADGGGLLSLSHANFEGTAVMHVYTHLPSSKAFFDFTFMKMQWANICNFHQFEFRSNVSSNLLQPLSSKVWIFRKIEEADSLSVGSWSADFFQASSFQLLKLENSLRWSLFTFIFYRSANMNYFIILHAAPIIHMWMRTSLSEAVGILGISFNITATIMF